jgi:hypothetical protein
MRTIVVTLFGSIRLGLRASQNSGDLILWIYSREDDYPVIVALIQEFVVQAAPRRSSSARDRVLSYGAEIMGGPWRGGALASAGGGGALRTDCRNSPEGG